ncbi:MAG: SDR family oxidoreductase [Gemmatimonadaceae bacterium]
MSPARPTALVTGASRGIGRAIALRLAARWQIIASARTAPELESLASEIRAGGGVCDPLVLDVSNGPAITDALAGRDVDVAINNAGLGVIRPLIDLTPEEWHRMVDVNLNAMYYVTRAALPGMVRRGRGHVVIIGSLAGRNAFIGGTGYSATKHAVVGFAESLMLEVRDAGVKVSLVMPGSVATSFGWGRGDADVSWKLTGEDVAATVEFLLDTPQRMLVDHVEMRPLNPPKKR